MSGMYKNRFDSMLAKVSKYYPDKNGSITASWVVSGNKYCCKNDLLIIGRAPIGPINSITINWLPSEASNKNKRSQIIGLIRAKAEDRSKCPMSWVIKYGHDNPICNTNKSAFWRVSKKIVQRRLVNYSGRNWSNYIAWSNLYKIVSADGGNPSRTLKKIQLNDCVELLRIELNLLNPNNILIMAGETWYQPFIERLDIKVIDSPGCFIEKIGQYKNCRIIFTQHPQSRRENYIDTIMEALRG